MTNEMKFLFILMVIFLGACSQDMVMNVPKEEPIEVSSKIEIGEALKNAEAVFAELGGGTRSSNRTVKSIQCVASYNGTRGSELADTMYYLVNYDNEAGFAVLSANRNNGLIFAIGEEGNLTFEDTVGNKCISRFFSYLDEKISRNSIQTRSDVIIRPTFPSDTIVEEVAISEVNFPKLTSTVNLWPGRDITPLYDKYPHVVISFAQTLTNFKQPSRWTSNRYPFDTIKLDWSLINTYKLDKNSDVSDQGFIEIDKLMSLVDESFINGSEFDFNMIKWFGDNYGYDIDQLYSPPMNVGGHEHQEPLDSNAEFWREALSEGRLIIAGDFFPYYFEVESLTSWVVDGFMRYKDNHRLKEYDADTLFHCVWGRGGNCNGYYAFVSDTNYMVSNPISKDSKYLPTDLPLDSIVKPFCYTIKAK